MSAPRVTSTHIREWAKDRRAQGLLPVLVRRLIQATSVTTDLSVPGGDAGSLAGFDGVVRTGQGCAWVPEGSSVWEMGCDGNPKGKADGDFEKRESQADDEAVFVFVTPRLWQNKDEWAKSVGERGLWKDVRAFDATDLETWLESAAGVHLWFAEQLGIAGSGIETPEHAWRVWSSQTEPAISVEALLAGREEAARRLVAAIDAKTTIVRVRADSLEEASAFAAVALAKRGHSRAAVVTQADGWRFVDANAGLDVAIAASRHTAAARAVRDGFTLIVPAGRAAPGPHETGGEVVVLDRASHQDFESALIQMGRDPADAARLSRSTGRSWSVYRRVYASNPAISHPAWLEDVSLLRTLATLTLVGRWNGSRAGDTGCVAEVDGRPYEELEQDLRRLARMDDAPVLQIGSVWHAKAPLELIYLVGPHLTQAHLARFFYVARAVLAVSDPALELDDDKRWMATVYGKVREQSGLVLAAIAESIAKLSVYAERSMDPQRDRVLAGVDGLVHELVHGATEERWLSLAALLPKLAEASPDVFLAAVRQSLDRSDSPVRRLIAETQGSDLGSRAWHAGLLWALETLAWAPNRLAAVCFILAELTSTPVKGNWSNTPARSLQSMFRTWWPQTAASQDQRLRVLDQLLQRYPAPAWRVLVALLSHDSFASANAMPRWREDNAGATESVREGAVVAGYARALKERLLLCASQAPERLTELMDCLRWLETADDPQLLVLFERAKGLSDVSRAAVRGRLRKMLSWHNSFDTAPDSPSRRHADLLAPYFDALAPSDFVLRNAWVFESAWVELPEGRDDHDSADRLREERRTVAWREICTAMGMEGALALVRAGADTRLVGRELARGEPQPQELATWLARLYAGDEDPNNRYIISGTLYGCSEGYRRAVLNALRTLIEEEELAKLLTLAPTSRTTWQFMESLDARARDIYWSMVPPGFFVDADPDGDVMLQQLDQRGRARSSFQVLGHRRRRSEAERAIALLERIAGGEEPDGPLPQGWDVTDAVERATQAGVDRRRLAFVELRYHGAFANGQSRAKNLYEEMLRDPSLFIEVLATAYAPAALDSDEGEEDDDRQQTARELARSVAREGSGAPGTQPEGAIDPGVFAQWLAEVRRLAQEHDIVKATEVTIGEWLAQVRVESDRWPPAPIRDVLEAASDLMRSGFSTGVFNGRGMTSRGVFEGGGQERTLANRYRSDAEALQSSHPNVSEMLLGLARDYDRFGRSEDDEAQLRRESP